MSAYAAVTSLKITIKRLLTSPRISIVYLSRKILQSAYDEVWPLQDVLKGSEKRTNSSKRVKDLEGQMREAVCKLEDVIESHVSDQFLSQSESLKGGRHPLFLDLQELTQDVDSFIETAKKMKEEYIKELESPSPDEEDDDATVSSRNDFDGNKSGMVGLSDQFYEIRDRLLSNRRPFVVSIVGMAGIGKTTLAKKIFQDSDISKTFDCRAFVGMGWKYELKEMLQAILAQVNPDSDEMLMEGDEKLYEYLFKSLNGRKYLIVLDDVWNTDFWNDFTRRLPNNDEFTKKFPQTNSGSRILVTTRLQQVAIPIISGSYGTYNMRFLNKEESWDLLRERVFGEELCPHQLEKAGKKIAEKCEGLPLLIVTVANLLSKAENNSEYWDRVAADKENSIFMDAYDQISKVLYPSYNYLPQHLKACFLYMGAFPQNYEVRRSRLINLWNAEGFVQLYPYKDFKSFVEQCFEGLVSSNLVVVRQRSCYNDKVKAWGLHSVFWHLCKREAENNKFLHILNCYEDGLAEGMQNQRRLSIYKNVLFGIKDVYASMASISTARSLLCTGPHHQYQLPICFGLRLLRVLDALTIRLYDFPTEVLKLVRLRYLALTYNGNLPPSISKLWSLQYLILHQHMSIKSTVVQSYLPVEIWDLDELRYLQIMGRDLPDPPHGAALLNLLTLLDVGAHSCTKGVLDSIPNLEKLRVQIVVAPHVAEPLSCFDHILDLRRLKSLQCVVVNPEPRSKIVAPPPSLPNLGVCHIRKLTLRGCGFPWKDMNKIAELPDLKLLKLQCYAFQGEEWEAAEYVFPSLEYLLIEDTDLVQWIAPYRTFPILTDLTIKNCYKLKEIPKISSVFKIQLIDCNPLAATCARQIGNSYCKLDVHSSWDDSNLKYDCQLASK